MTVTRGYFQFDEQNRAAGKVRIFAFSRQFVLRPSGRDGGKNPAFRIVDPTDDFIEFGSVWRERSNKGVDFYSMHFEGPEFGPAGQVRLAAFRDQDGGDRWSVVYRAPRAERAN